MSRASAALDHLTEQPGAGHMVMAAARTLARRRMVLVRPLRQPAPGNQHATPDNPTATSTFLALEDLPPLAGVKLVRPRRCAAAGAPA